MKVIPLKTYTIRKAGERGLVISIPKEYAKLNDLQAGDEVMVYLVKEDTRMMIVEVRRSP
jgi:antitoxin component of MazEF toxin-antitoxin module